MGVSRVPPSLGVSNKLSGGSTAMVLSVKTERPDRLLTWMLSLQGEKQCVERKA